jgi:D-glycero-alpha-D-manno-heptose-7-phosphate kinase
MILTKAPFRISLAGGGSDLPAFYRKHTGVVVSTTIDKSMYIAVHPYFQDKIRIKYSRTEDVSNTAEIQHPLVRECLRNMKIECGMEIASFADVPAGTGMGSSSAFTVCLLHALHTLAGREPSAQELAETACHIEIDQVAEPIGKQDQYATAFGGLNRYRFHADESVEVCPVACSEAIRKELNRRLMLFYVAGQREASSVLCEQSRNMADPAKFAAVVKLAALADELCAALEQSQLDSVGDILHQSWLLKSRLAHGITNSAIDSSYRLAREAGVEGGKLLGAGSGGFLLLCCRQEKQAQVREALAHMQEMPFAMSCEGSGVLYNDGQNEPILVARGSVPIPLS